MSTKSKKLYSKADLREAERMHEEVRKTFSRMTQKRKTVQVRIDEKWHRRLKELAVSEGMLISFMLDKICKKFFDNYKK